MPDFQSTADLETLRQRDELVRKIRHFFESRNFLHVETPLLSHDTVVDRYLEPIGIPQSAVFSNRGREEERLWLQTSPEFAMKRLVASGARNIYQICKAFRKGEQGSRHNPEFTMLEWYRAGDNLQQGMDLLSEFAQAILDCQPAEQISYRDAFVRHADVDPFNDSITSLADACRQQQVDVAAFADVKDRDEWLNLIVSEIVEPKLGLDRPTIVFNWPASQAALAVLRTDATGIEVAERFELFIGGVELANGYHELLCADELLRRNDWVNEQRVTDGAASLPRESRMLNAMRAGLPACAGVALGIDRLAMVALGKESIDQVIPFPIDRA